MMQCPAAFSSLLVVTVESNGAQTTTSAASVACGQETFNEAKIHVHFIDQSDLLS